MKNGVSNTLISVLCFVCYFIFNLKLHRKQFFFVLLCMKHNGQLMKKFLLIFFVSILAACEQRNAARQSQPAATVAVPSHAEVKFPIPKIPDILTGTEERMNFLLEHYWQEYDFNDTTELNRNIGEQGFANFLSLLQRADSSIVARSVRHFLQGGFAQDSLRTYYNALIRHYLDNPQSPMRNDVIYVHFLREQMPFYPNDDVAARERCAFLLNMVGRNQSGEVAADFSFIDRKGNRNRLHKVKSPFTLVIFNDPDCETCMQEMPRLAAIPLLQHDDLAVIAVYPDANVKSWKASRHDLPDSWTDAYSPDGEVMHHAIYYLPAMPSLYLLDADKRILLKDASPEQVCQYLSTHLMQQDTRNSQ